MRPTLPLLFAASALLSFSILACKSDPQRAGDQAAASASVAPAAAAPTIDPMAAGARDQFEKALSCPTDRVTLKPRPDIDPAQFHVPKAQLPSDEVQRDPARLAKWNADQAAEKKSAHELYADHSIFEVSGCGHTQFQDCRPHHANGAVYPDLADCSEVKQPK